VSTLHSSTSTPRSWAIQHLCRQLDNVVRDRKGHFVLGGKAPSRSGRSTRSACAPHEEAATPSTADGRACVLARFTSLQPRTHSNPTRPGRQTAGGPVLSVFGSRTHTDVVREFRTTRFATAPPQSGTPPGGAERQNETPETTAISSPAKVNPAESTMRTRRQALVV
jgi:hypothetical protein